jgi:hypothetical protein
MSKMSLTRRNEVIRVKALGELGFAPSAPIDPWSRTLTGYVGRECPACMILTRLKSALQEPCMAPDQTPTTGARKLGLSHFVLLLEKPWAAASPNSLHLQPDDTVIRQSSDNRSKYRPHTLMVVATIFSFQLNFSSSCDCQGFKSYALPAL